MSIQSQQPLPTGGQRTGPRSMPTQGKRQEDMPINYESPLQYTRRIRNLVVKSQPFSQVDGDGIRTQLAMRQLEEHAKVLENTYTEFEKWAKSLPSSTPVHAHIPTFDPLNKYVYEADSDIMTMKNFDMAREFATTHRENAYMNREYTNTNYTLFFTSCIKDFMAPMTVQQRRSNFELDPPLPDFDNNSTVKNQIELERILHEIVAIDQKSPNRNNYVSMEFRFLERSRHHSVVEIETITLLHRGGLKFLLLINDGNIEYINVYGISEDYVYLDETRRKIDIYASSKCQLFEQWSRQLNSSYQQFVNGSNRGTELTLTMRLQFIISCLSKLNMVLGNPCRVCKELLRNGKLPVVVDIRTKHVTHEECR